MNDRVKEIRARLEVITPGPWAWEQYGEKENCFRVGVAFDKKDNQLCGSVETHSFDEKRAVFVEDVLWREQIGGMEGATVNYNDAEFIAHSPDDIAYLLEQVERLQPKTCGVYSTDDGAIYFNCGNLSNYCVDDGTPNYDYCPYCGGKIEVK